ncbi:MAG: DUF1851 domain-containing protein [Alphaproteobacteria bacterium]|nr:DUF1851 domain-containing protein [Alphaproteobacteria bacterium]
MAFTDHYVPDNQPLVSDDPLLDQVDEISPGFTDFMRRHSGTSFNDGLYRVHAIDSIRPLTALCLQAFPAYENKILCFASSWLGEQFAINLTRRVDRRVVLMMDSGSGEVFEIPADFMEFHNSLLIDQKDEILNTKFYEDWLNTGGRAPAHNECIGFKIPLFLNGTDDVANLELIDMEVYWSIHAQLIEQTKDLPPGTKIDKVTISD